MATYETSGTLTTQAKQADGEAYEVQFVATVPTDTSVTATIKQDESGGTTADSTEQVSVGDGTNTYSLSNFANSVGGTYWIQFDLSTSDDSATPNVDDAIVSVGNYYLRFSNIAADAAIDNDRTVDKSRSSSVSGDAAVDNDRSLDKVRTSATYADAAIDNNRIVTKNRTYTIVGDGTINTTQEISPVFPDEQALDVSWDFDNDLMAFVTEWLSEESHIPDVDRDGVGVVLGGDLSTTIEVFVQYDKTGDGTPDVTSTTKELSSAYHTVAFDDNRLFGADGYYRIGVRGMRSGDTINQADIGAVHENL
jgi:hypothetical protein